MLVHIWAKQMKPDSRARIEFCCFFSSLASYSPNDVAAVYYIVIDSAYTDVGFRYYLLYFVFMLPHSHSFLILIRIRLVYQISFAACHYTACGLSVSFLHCHSACQISKPDLIVSASDPAIWFRISSSNWYNCWSVTTWYCDCYYTTAATKVMQKIGFLVKWRSQTTVAHIVPEWTNGRTVNWSK